MITERINAKVDIFDIIYYAILLKACFKVISKGKVRC